MMTYLETDFTDREWQTSLNYEMEGPQNLEWNGEILKVTVFPEDHVADANRAEIKYFTTDRVRMNFNYKLRFMLPDEFVFASRDDLNGQFITQFMGAKTRSWQRPTRPFIAVRHAFNGQDSGIGFNILGKSVGSYVPINKNEWYDLEISGRYATKNKHSGIIVFKINDEEIVIHRGRNMYKNRPVYFKAGIYRKDGFTEASSILFDSLYYESIVV